jgi:putative membrane protein
MGVVGVYLRGVCMGAADAVPGVSGGTIALITGIYDRLVAALTAIEPDRVWRTLRALARGDWATAREALLRMDAGFLVALGTGVFTAVLLMTSVVETAVTEAPVPTFAFFFGLIAASALVLYDQLHLDTRGRRVAAVVGFTVAFLVSGLTNGAVATSLPMTFVAGAVAVTAMVLPGISGSLLLLILGQYVYMVTSLHDFVNALPGLVEGSVPPALVTAGTVVATFVAGAAVGLFAAAHVISAALERWREATLAFLVSLIVGALRAPAERVADGVTSWDAATGVEVAVPLAVGAAVVLAFDRYAGIEY